MSETAPSTQAGGTRVFAGGSVFDGHAHLPDAWLLTTDARVEAIGTGPAPPADEVVDLAGGLVTRGFVDAHVHAVQGGLERIRCDLSGDADRADYLDTVARYAAAHPEHDWILGGGWAMPAFDGGTAPAADLDAVVGDRRVFLMNRDHHGAWVSSATLRAAGITRDTPDPPDGHLDRLPDGTPNGTLHEGAMDLVSGAIPRPDDEESDAALDEAQRHLLAFGITGWQDAILGDYAAVSDPAPAYLRAAASGRLLPRVVGALWWERDRGVEQLADLVQRRDRFTSGRLRATSVKIMADGIVENRTAAMLAPYRHRCGQQHDHPEGAEGGSGHSFLDPAALAEAVVAVAGAGFQVHIHAIGDRAVREALDAVAAADRPDLRPHLAHLQTVHPDDVARFAPLGVTANLQALWACWDDAMADLTEPILDAETFARQYPFGDLHRAGARLAMGSDWPVSSPDPLQAIHVAVNRTAYAAPGREGSEPLLPDQALDLRTAMAAYTSGSASLCGYADTTLAPGALADLTVLDRDPFRGPPEQIGAARCVSTWIEGVCVFDGRGGRA